MEFWNSDLTEKSWKILREFKKDHNFVLIGGWATYLWARRQKSKDIDIVVEIDELQKLKNEGLSKNDNLKKYEIKKGETDIDIYVSYFSKLTIPVEDIRRYSKKVEGFDVVSREALVILKQGAEIERKNSIKGEKDRIDIISLIWADFDYAEYKRLLIKYKLENYIEKLICLIRDFVDFDSLNLNPREFKLNKIEILNKLKML